MRLKTEFPSPASAYLLSDIAKLFLARGWRAEGRYEDKSLGRAFTRNLLAALGDLKDPVWAVLLKGKKMNEYWLSQQLRAYGVVPKTMRIGEELAKGYLADDVWEALGRYNCVPAGQGQTSEGGKEGEAALEVDGPAVKPKGGLSEQTGVAETQLALRGFLTGGPELEAVA